MGKKRERKNSEEVKRNLRGCSWTIVNLEGRLIHQRYKRKRKGKKENSLILIRYRRQMVASRKKGVEAWERTELSAGFLQKECSSDKEGGGEGKKGKGCLFRHLRKYLF